MFCAILNIILHNTLIHYVQGTGYKQAGKTGGEVSVMEDQVHQNPEVFPPGGILTLTELLVGEFLTWS